MNLFQQALIALKKNQSASEARIGGYYTSDGAVNALQRSEDMGHDTALGLDLSEQGMLQSMRGQ